MDSNCLTLVDLVDTISGSWGGNVLVAAGYWSISIGVWAVGIRSSNIGSNRWLSFTLSNVVSSITIGPGITITIGIVTIVIVSIAIARVAIKDRSISFWLSSNSSSKAKEGNLKINWYAF